MLTALPFDYDFYYLGADDHSSQYRIVVHDDSVRCRIDIDSAYGDDMCTLTLSPIRGPALSTVTIRSDHLVDGIIAILLSTDIIQEKPMETSALIEAFLNDVEGVVGVENTGTTTDAGDDVYIIDIADASTAHEVIMYTRPDRSDVTFEMWEGEWNRENRIDEITVPRTEAVKALDSFMRENILGG